MRTSLMIAAAAAITLQARQVEITDENSVTIYLENRLAPREDFVAKGQVEQMFASAGVRIVWRTGSPSTLAMAEERPIVVTFVFHTVAVDHPGALAFALPYEGTHVKVFYDRVRLVNPSWIEAVLAHVLVHEITHLLQGIDRHSQAGVMKANWTTTDYRDMTWRPLSFTAGDIELIRSGLKARRATRLHASHS